MLKTPLSLRSTSNNPILAIVAGNRGVEDKPLEDGFMQITHFSGDMLIWGRNAPEMYMGWPELGDDLNAYGVCDSPKQFIDKFKDRLAADEQRTFFVTFTHVAKEPENKGCGGGWRWHKWGPYIGAGDPQHEYLDDEEGFADGVYVYHVYQIDGPEKER